MSNNINHILEKIASILRKNPRVHKGILFGSRAMDRARNGSDIDIALYGDISYDDILSIYSQYDSLYLPYKVDFIDYNLISNHALREHISRVGRVILEK